MKRHLIHVMVVLAVLVPAGLPQAAQFKTKEEVLAHLIANSPYKDTGSGVAKEDVSLLAT
ncbi:MAG: hypothetical protein L0Y78_10180 [candidate division NC10 bacterium]|nr:hypothetical protein [candidate division NC10 bacterium]